MSSQVLARKWRPRDFQSLVGQEHVITALANAFRQQRLHHAYLLTGTRGVGKTTIARIMAKALNCETGITAEPCNQCSHCVQIDSGRFVDLLEIDAASNTGIDNIREVLDNAQYAPTQGRFKVYIIDEVHMLSKSAFNAMLKTLEEPPGHVKFILATTDPQKVPVTILSRCLQFALRQMLPHQISGHLGKVLEAEGIPFEADALAQLGEAAQGSMRDALSLLDQAIAFGGGKVDAAGVRAMLGAVDGGHMLTLLDALATADGPRLLATAQQLLQMGVGAEAVLQELASLLYQLGLLHRVPAALNDGQRARLSPFAARFEEADLQLYYQIALHGRRDVQLAPDESAGLCMPLLRMLALAPQSPPEASTLPNMTAVSSPTPTGTFVSTPVAAGKALTEVAVATPLADTQDVAPPSAPKSKADTTTAVADDPAAIDDSPEDEPAASTPPPFEGDWPALVAALPLGAQARMLALHAALIDWQDDVFELAIAERDRFLLDAAFQSRLSDALSQWFGRTIQVRVRAAAEAEGATPAAQQQQARQRRQAEAEAVINADPFVRRLMTEFGATLIPDSLRPA